jgi:hypothetical protein
MQHLASPAPGASPQTYDSALTTTVYVAIVVTMCPLIFYTGVYMQSKTVLSQSIFPNRIWEIIQCTLHEAVTGFEEEWGSYEELEQRVTA